MGATVLDDLDELIAENRAQKAEIERLRSELRKAKAEFECQRNWLDRAVTSNYQYNNDPALPGHRQAADEAVKRIGDVLEQRVSDAKK